MRVHKRKKTSRIRGAKTCGWGFRQKHKGHGNKGGVGMAGSGKKADHKKQWALNKDPKGIYFGKQGLTSRATKKKKYQKINLSDIKYNFFKKAGEKLDFSKHKILGNGEGFKAEIKAKAASRSAIEKMQKSGGNIILPEKKVEKKKETKGEIKEPVKIEEKKKIKDDVKVKKDESKQVVKAVNKTKKQDKK